MIPDWFLDLLARARQLQLYVSIDYDPDDKLTVRLTQYGTPCEVELSGAPSWALDAIAQAMDLMPLPSSDM